MAEPLKCDPIHQAHRNWVHQGWSEAADGMAAVTSLFRAQQIFMSRISGLLKEYDLTFARFELLALLSFTQSGGMPMHKASQRLQVHPTSVTNSVDRLERAGYVHRVTHPVDRRTTLVQITEVGRACSQRAALALNREIFEQPDIPAEDLTELYRILSGFRFRAGDFTEVDARPDGSAKH